MSDDLPAREHKPECAVWVDRIKGYDICGWVHPDPGCLGCADRDVAMEPGGKPDWLHEELR